MSEVDNISANLAWLIYKDAKVTPSSRTVGKDQVVDEFIVSFTHDTKSRPQPQAADGCPLPQAKIEWAGGLHGSDCRRQGQRGFCLYRKYGFMDFRRSSGDCCCRRVQLSSFFGMKNE